MISSSRYLKPADNVIERNQNSALKALFSWKVIAIAKNKYEYWLTSEGLTLLSGWAKDGLTDEQIAAKIKISRSTLSEWKNKYEEISDALKKGKEIVDYEVEDSLYKKAVGYDIKETRAFKCKSIYYDENGNKCQKEEVITVEVERHIPGDTVAMAIWLNNRKSTKWRKNANKETLDKEKFEHEKNIDNKKHF